MWWLGSVRVVGGAGGPRVGGTAQIQDRRTEEPQLLSPLPGLAGPAQGTNETPERPNGAGQLPSQTRETTVLISKLGLWSPAAISGRPHSAVPWLPQSASRSRGVTDGVVGGWGCLGPWSIRPGNARRTRTRAWHVVHVVPRCGAAPRPFRGGAVQKGQTTPVFLSVDTGLHTGHGIQHHRAMRCDAMRRAGGAGSPGRSMARRCAGAFRDRIQGLRLRAPEFPTSPFPSHNLHTRTTSIKHHPKTVPARLAPSATTPPPQNSPTGSSSRPLHPPNPSRIRLQQPH